MSSVISWVQDEADRLLKNLPSDVQTVRFQTGYGPSGLPHLGTFAEVVRTCFILKAIKHKAPHLNTELIAFSDDLDGLRSVPENVEGKAHLKQYMGVPLSAIPDPYGQFESYADYMNHQLQLFLDSFGFEYTFVSSTKTYQSGLFDPYLQKILEHYDQIKEVFTRQIAKDKREAWSPFFPICEACGKIYTTQVTKVDADSKLIHYQCTQDQWNPCGYEGVMPPVGGKLKVGWKIDWGMRWAALGIHYEMHGKDLLESVPVSAKVCQILGKTPPLTYKYELFLDEAGQKISKKIGNGISMTQWLSYAPLGALLHFLLGNPNKPKKMGLPILPRLVDDFFRSTQDSETEFSALWFLKQFGRGDKPIVPDAPPKLSYALLANVAESIGIQSADLLMNYVKRYDPQASPQFYQGLCQCVIQFVQEYQKTLPAEEVSLGDIDTSWLQKIRDGLHEIDESDFQDGERLQSFLFAIGQEATADQKKWFEFLYSALLHKKSGPKLGPFLAVLGKAEAIKLFEDVLL